MNAIFPVSSTSVSQNGVKICLYKHDTSRTFKHIYSQEESYWVYISQPRWYNTPLPPKFSVTEDGLTAETSLTINSFKWNWRIIYPKSHHDELPIYRRIYILLLLTYKDKLLQLLSTYFFTIVNFFLRIKNNSFNQYYSIHTMCVMKNTFHKSSLLDFKLQVFLEILFYTSKCSFNIRIIPFIKSMTPLWISRHFKNFNTIVVFTIVKKALVN